MYTLYDHVHGHFLLFNNTRILSGNFVIYLQVSLALRRNFWSHKYTANDQLNNVVIQLMGNNLSKVVIGVTGMTT